MEIDVFEKIRKDLKILLIETKVNYIKYSDNQKYKIGYSLLEQFYKAISTISTEKQMRAYLNELIKRVTQYKDEYNILHLKYDNSDVSSKKSIVKPLNKKIYEIDTYNSVINIIKKYLNKSEKKTSPVKSETKKVENNSFINELENESNLIVRMLLKYNSLDNNSSEAIKLNNEIYNKRIEREKRLLDSLGNESLVIINELNSNENMLSVCPKKIASYKADKDMLLKEFKTCIGAINEYYFQNELKNLTHYNKNSDLYQSFLSYCKRLKNLLYSLYDSSEFDIEEFISYLSICFVDGNYSMYKDKFSNTKIGNEEVDKSNYENINNYVNSIISKVISDINKLNKTIVVSDKSISINDLKSQRTVIFNKLYNLYMRNNRGERNVIR